MTTTAQCARCNKLIAAGEGEYTKSGDFLCATCIGEVQIAEGEAAVTAGKRRWRIAVGVSVAFVVAIPSVLFAVGLGHYVSKGLLGLGIAMVVLSGIVVRLMVLQVGLGARDPAMKRLYVRTFLSLLAGAIVLMILAGLLSPGPRLNP